MARIRIHAWLALVACAACATTLAAAPLGPVAKPLAEPGPDAYAIRPINSLGVGIGAKPGVLPTNYAAEHGVASPSPLASARSWPITCYHWAASASRSNPLYFEEVNAERYGYACGCLQPVVSTVHFFGTVPYLPYLMASDCPRECVYTLGHYRPGSCAPYRSHGWPVDLLGAAAEGGAVAGLILLVP
ncbi:hypothetical protein Mal64_02550 [Pseudobythopirellula maris]|uniref:Uncharacterized protein n=1 Tax=Pseudobythopirellula maris TaxID=2527991 RepID=A0A5C5ZUK4_9BACT|nr:hypothetical protein [Pseudobythopirellula maris]TWT89873.1 hypothetical protein Mal64_02550 [Pseudobythopirellula maris]